MPGVMDEFNRALGSSSQPGSLEKLGQALASYGNAVSDRVGFMWDKGMGLSRLPEEADRIAEQRFPGYERDSSTKNAFRHALGTGMVAQDVGDILGGSMPAKVAAGALTKMVGYGWESGKWLDAYWNRLKGTPHSPQLLKDLEDSSHDLNANAIGASEALGARDRNGLIQALETMARNSRQEVPPTPLAPSPGYMTRTKR